MDRPAGFEPAPQPWQGRVLPLTPWAEEGVLMTQYPASWGSCSDRPGVPGILHRCEMVEEDGLAPSVSRVSDGCLTALASLRWHRW